MGLFSLFGKKDEYTVAFIPLGKRKTVTVRARSASAARKKVKSKYGTVKITRAKKAKR